MFHYVFKDEFVTLVSLKVPSGCWTIFFLCVCVCVFFEHLVSFALLCIRKNFPALNLTRTSKKRIPKMS